MPPFSHYFTQEHKNKIKGKILPMSFFTAVKVNNGYYGSETFGPD